MKKLIITITLLIALVGSVFAAPKMTNCTIDKNQTITKTWECEKLDNVFITSSETIEEFFTELVVDNVKPTFLPKAESINSYKNKDVVYLLEMYNYTITYNNGYFFCYYLEDGKVWTMVWER